MPLSVKVLFLASFSILTALLTSAVIMKFSSPPQLLAAFSSLTLATAQQDQQCGSASHNISLSWHAPAKTQVNTLSSVINSTGTWGFIFNSSATEATYNYCNMPHTSPSTYSRPSSDYKLEYVELIHRHHKRTPYAANTFPKETYSWSCSDEGLFYGGQPLNPASNGTGAADTYWSVYTSDANPFAPEGFNGTCQFPQITRGGLEDSRRHGVDLKAVYGDLLGFLPSEDDPQVVEWRVTNNVITSQVASMLIPGLYPGLEGVDVPLNIQPDSIDSLEPTYSCPSADSLFASYGPGSDAAGWKQHITASASLKKSLDAISGVDPTDEDWSKSWDHYFDNLSSRLCHAKPLPCSPTNATTCVSSAQANEVFRLGEYEYAYIYRASPLSLPASVASYGVFLAELSANLRAAMDPSSAGSKVRYRHNVAHDGFLSRLLSILQLETMVWPGMGAEVVFELYTKAEEGCWFVRVLWGGRPLVSSHPGFGQMDMLPVETLLGYFDGLVGVGAGKVPGLCEQEG